MQPVRNPKVPSSIPGKDQASGHVFLHLMPLFTKQTIGIWDFSIYCVLILEKTNYLEDGARLSLTPSLKPEKGLHMPYTPLPVIVALPSQTTGSCVPKHGEVGGGGGGWMQDGWTGG